MPKKKKPKKRDKPDIPVIHRRDIVGQKDFLIAEYNTLREEIMNKYNIRTAVLVMTNTIIGLILGYTIKESAYYGLFVLSFAIPIFGMIVLYCGYSINKIGDYLFERFNNEITGFYWETYVREYRETKKNPYRYKFTFRVPATILFVVFPLILLTGYMIFFSDRSILEIILSVANLVLILWVLVGYLSLQKLREESFFSH